MRITAFAGSTSSQSINRQLVQYVLKSFPDADVRLLDLNDYDMPVFSVDREKNGFPEATHRFLAAFKDCDLILCSLAEHNRSVTAAFKNIFDWASRVELKVFQGKKMFLLSTSTGRYGGGNAMRYGSTFFPDFGAEILETFSLPQFQINFDAEKQTITDAALAADLAAKTEKVKTALATPADTQTAAS